MSKYPYYVTWTSQKDAIQINVKETTNDLYILEDGSELFDLSSCSYHQSFGLKNQTIQNSLKKQIDTLPLLGPKFGFELKTKVTQRLLKRLGLDGKIFYTTSGSESVENALKIVRDMTGKDLILRRKDSYHGATLGSLSVTGDWRSENITNLSSLSLTIPGPFEKDSLSKIETIIKENHSRGIAAIILETITGGNGVIIPSLKWYEGIQYLCEKYDIKMILDEVVCGFSRTGKDFGFHHYPKLRPDLICLSKSITGGFIPFGAVYTSQEVAEYYEDHQLKCGLTNYAHPLGLSALDSVLDIMEQEEFRNLKEKRTTVLEDGLKEIAKQSKVREVRQIGLLAAIELHDKNQLTQKELISHGVFANFIDDNIILAPFLNTYDKNLEAALKIIKEVL